MRSSDAKPPPALTDHGARGLRVVLPEHELQGHAPLVYERLAKVARPGSAEHRGIVAIALALARHAVTRCLPPSARTHLVPAFATLEAFASGNIPSGAKAARDARALAFSALPSIESQAKSAVERASQAMLAGRVGAIHDHAEHTLARFVGLSVHHAVAAACHALDAIEAPEPVLAVPSDACGALAYSRTALGSVRNPEFQEAAVNQARWEHERAARERSVPLGALEIQIFHEYLGARWRAHADQERRTSDEFIAWALEGAPG